MISLSTIRRNSKITGENPLSVVFITSERSIYHRVSLLPEASQLRRGLSVFITVMGMLLVLPSTFELGMVEDDMVVSQS
jgi:hypothetical protein